MVSEKIRPKPVTRVRKIGVRTEHVRGQLGAGQEYESLLERDFLTLLRIDPSVLSFVAQPLAIGYSVLGKPRRYVPDVLVHYKPDSLGNHRKPSLVEVKPAAFIDKPDQVLQAKFDAARSRCDAEGWSFVVATESEIHTPRLINANFLVRYLRRECDPAHRELLLEQLELWNGCAAVCALLAGVFRSKVSQAELLPDLWTMVARGELYADLDVPLTMRSEIWLL